MPVCLGIFGTCEEANEQQYIVGSLELALQTVDFDHPVVFFPLNLTDEQLEASAKLNTDYSKNNKGFFDFSSIVNSFTETLAYKDYKSDAEYVIVSNFANSNLLKDNDIGALKSVASIAETIAESVGSVASELVYFQVHAKTGDGKISWQKSRDRYVDENSNSIFATISFPLQGNDETNFCWNIDGNQKMPDLNVKTLNCEGSYKIYKTPVGHGAVYLMGSGDDHPGNVYFQDPTKFYNKDGHIVANIQAVLPRA